MRRPHLSRSQRGLSLVEAMVAMAVMGFGTLAVLGVQASLRLNGDIAKQRSEALRIAQETLENSRAFPDLDAFTALATDDGSAVDGYTTNTSYTATLTVLDPAADIEEEAAAQTLAPRRTLSVVVTWTDRAGVEQSVELHSAVTGVEPVLAGTLAVPASTSFVQNPGGRSPLIPRNATPQSDGTSVFTPPGAGPGVSWVFNNNTGYITQVCSGIGDAACVDFNARLLSGFIRFAVGSSQPTPQQAEVPPSPRPSGMQPQVRVLQTYPTTATVNCFEEQTTSYVAYYCAVPLGADVMWSGTAELVIVDSDNDSLIASDIDDDDDDEYKVCRYTAYRDHRTAPANMSNEQHPRIYAQVKTGLVNQNYLMIRAGDDDDTAFTCPDDDTSTSFVNGRTWHHQPHE